jgi:hypothetical protein
MRLVASPSADSGTTATLISSPTRSTRNRRSLLSATPRGLNLACADAASSVWRSPVPWVSVTTGSSRGAQSHRRLPGEAVRWIHRHPVFADAAFLALTTAGLGPLLHRRYGGWATRPKRWTVGW